MAAIAAFVLLDFTTLAFNYWISSVLEADAIAINLAGRQRMLSQQVTKASVLSISLSQSTIEAVREMDEAAEAYDLFRSTLAAFSAGGQAVGSDGRPVMLEKVTGEAALLLGDVRGLTSQWPSVPRSREELARFSEFMIKHNESILDAMNQFTGALEQHSRETVFHLRIAQTLAFSFSLGNFVLILVLMHRARRRAVTDSMTDALTGLLNRAGLYGALISVVADSERYKTPHGVLLIDLDGFKAVNDTYGHAAGDEVLREVAHRLLTWRRPGWVCGRLGGDEFAVICTGVDSEQLDQIVADVSKILSGIPARELLVSASVGKSAFEPGNDADAMIARADASMYADKNRKRGTGAFRETHR